MKRYLQCLCGVFFYCLLSSVQATQFEFGRLRVTNCITPSDPAECVIKFTHTYSTVPLVFLMPTITQDGKNLPSSLRLLSTSKTQAAIRQVIAPHSAVSAGANFRAVPMTDIRYLVIEPGMYTFSSGAKIVVGTFLSDSHIRDKSGKFQKINFSDFGLKKFSPWKGSTQTIPAILSQIQSANNVYDHNDVSGHYARGQPQWMTSVTKAATLSSFRYAIELSEVKGSALRTPETVGFIAGVGSGFINGKKFWLGVSRSTASSGVKDNILGPVETECNKYIEIPVDMNSPIVISSINSRVGQNGGWLRLCQQKGNKVSFVHEEDMDLDAERSHSAEKIGLMVFEGRSSSPICERFPSAVQTWKGNAVGSLYIANDGQVENADLIDGQRYVGFEPLTVDDTKKSGCDKAECFGDTGLMVVKPNLPAFEAPTDSNLYNVVVNAGNRVFQNSEHIGSLTIDIGSSATFKTGTYWIDSINALGNIDVPKGEKVTINTKGLALSKGSHFIAESVGDLVVVVHNLAFSYTSVIHNWVDLANNAVFKGLLYSESTVELSNGSVIEGAVTALQVSIHNDAKIIGAGHCFEPPPGLELVLEPDSGRGFSCTGVNVSMRVRDSKTLEEADFSGNVTVELNTSSDIGACLVKLGERPNARCGESGQPRSFTFQYPQDKDLTLYSKYSGKVYLNAVATENSNLSAQNFGPYQFLAKGFLLNSRSDVDGVDGGQITDRMYGLTIQVVSSGNGSLSCDPVESYTSTAVPISFTRAIQGDQTNAGKFTITESGTEHVITENNVINIDFEKGVGKTSLTGKYTEAGTALLSASGPAVCEASGCDDSLRISSNSLPLYHRPFSLAICDATDPSTPMSYGTSEGGDGLVASGVKAAFSIKAIPWLTSYGSSIRGSLTNVPPLSASLGASYKAFATSFCGARTLKAYKGSGGIGVGVNSPTPNGHLGNVTLDIPSKPNVGIYSSTVIWDEVGSLLFKVGKDDYLVSGLNIPKANFVVGRFYPHHLTINSNRWTYPTNQTGFAYMGQTFIHAMEVEARNIGQGATSNYGFFEDSLKASLSFLVTNGTDDANNDLSARVENFIVYSWGGEMWNSRGNTSQMAQTMSDFVFNRLVDPTNGNATLADGPFDDASSAYGLYVSHSADPIDFDNLNITVRRQDTTSNLGSRFTEAADIRYGRMRFDSGSGQVKTNISAPLQVEFWDGGEFTVNGADSRANFDGADYCKLTMQPAGGVNSGSLLAGSATVAGGESGRLSANADPDEDNLREQVRLWLRLSASPQGTEAGVTCFGAVPTGTDIQNQPWLQFNWRNVGDEDPSGIFSFGVYRGNDRVIYRGEPNIR